MIATSPPLPLPRHDDAIIEDPPSYIRKHTEHSMSFTNTRIPPSPTGLSPSSSPHKASPVSHSEVPQFKRHKGNKKPPRKHRLKGKREERFVKTPTPSPLLLPGVGEGLRSAPQTVFCGTWVAYG
ncbi:hypothetical protein V8C26DRAFT_397312 [Trichoderma gracile]